MGSISITRVHDFSEVPLLSVLSSSGSMFGLLVDCRRVPGGPKGP